MDGSNGGAGDHRSPSNGLPELSRLEGGSLKRPYDGSNDSQPEAKKMASDPLNVNSKDMSISDSMNVPDHLVGLLIGKGGEQIASIQAQTDCKVQFAPESGTTERVCTLIGTISAIQRAKDVISELVDKMQDVGPPPNQSSGGHHGGHSIEMLIPGSKVGLVIGKGGETIKMLQERHGVKIMVIQDNTKAGNQDKPLRISGDRGACQRARQNVLDLMAEKDNPMGFQGGFGGSRGGGGGKLEIAVPRDKVAMIIGKGGDVIRRIQEQSGCRVQFKTDEGGPTRMCTVSGEDHCIDIANNIIRDIMENGTRHSLGRGGPPGGFGGPGGPEWGPGGPPPGLPGVRGVSGPNGMQYAIPAEKCGLVIGKGGETIKEINRITGAHCELNRDSANDKHERLFRIQGSPDQMQHAIQLIHDKAGLGPPMAGGFPGPAPGPMGGPPMIGGPMPGVPGMPGPIPGAPMGPNPYGPPATSGPPGMIPPGMVPPQQPAPAYGQPWGQPYPQPQPAPQAPVSFAQPAPAMPGPAPIDPTKPPVAAVDPNAAAWAAYYAQYYGQQQQPQPAPASVAPAMAPMQQPAAQPMAYPGIPASAAPAPAPAPVAAQPQPTINQATGQLDYSAAWAEYYRQQGMHQHAAAILANQAAAHAAAGVPH